MEYQYDSQIKEVVAYAPHIDLADLSATRAMLVDLAASFPPYTPSDAVRLEEFTIPARGHTPAVDVFVLTGADAPKGGRPAVLWFHGGGFVLGDARESLPFLDKVVMDTGGVAVSVQYRLAPETPFPGAADDAHSALIWLLEMQEHFSLDLERIAIGGQSAGAALAAGLVLRARDENGPKIAFQLLDIPVTDDRCATQSAVEYTDTLVWNRANALLGWKAYLDDNTEQVSPYAVPARAKDLSNLPPTFITINQFDPLRDEGLEFARRLAHANVPTELHLYAGTFHGSSAIVAAAAVSERQNADIRNAFCRALLMGGGKA